MKLLISAFGILCVSTVVTAKPFWCPWCQQPTFTEYGPNIERDGFCPNEPRESLCDTNFCNQVGWQNHETLYQMLEYK